MYYVYIIKSSHKNWFYVGFTSDIVRRFYEHNFGSNRSTKPYRPFELVFVQIIENRLLARDLEKYLKIKFNKEALLDIII